MRVLDDVMLLLVVVGCTVAVEVDAWKPCSASSSSVGVVSLCQEV